MDLGLKDKVALICGASRGIGYATAEEFAREGASLVICSRDEGAIAAAAAKLTPFGGKVVGVAADLSTETGLSTAIERAKGAFGQIDVLVTNTGGPPVHAPMEPDWAAYTRASELLLRSVVELTRAFVPGMRERKWGRVISITSLAVKQPVKGLVLTNAFRAAVTGYLRTLAEDVASDGVTVNTVLPGLTDTDRLRSLADTAAKQQGSTREAIYDRYRADTPARRLGTADEIASVITFLASTRAAFVTGQAILVDGGTVRALL